MPDNNNNNELKRQIKETLDSWFKEKNQHDLDIQTIENDDRIGLVVTGEDIEKSGQVLLEKIQEINPNTSMKNPFQLMSKVFKKNVGKFSCIAFVDYKKEDNRTAKAILYIDKKDVVYNYPTANFKDEIEGEYSTVIKTEYKPIEKATREAIDIVSLQMEINASIRRNIYNNSYILSDEEIRFPSVKSYIITKDAHEDEKGKHVVRPIGKDAFVSEIEKKTKIMETMMETEVAVIFLKDKKTIIVDYMPINKNDISDEKLFEKIRNTFPSMQTTETRNGRFFIFDKATNDIYLQILNIVLRNTHMTSKEDREKIKKNRAEEIKTRRGIVSKIEDNIKQKYMERINDSLVFEAHIINEDYEKLKNRVEKFLDIVVSTIVENQIPSDANIINIMWDTFYIERNKDIDTCQIFGFGSHIDQNCVDTLSRVSNKLINIVDLQMILYADQQLGTTIKNIIIRQRIAEQGQVQFIFVGRNKPFDTEKIKGEIESILQDDNISIKVLKIKEALAEGIDRDSNTIYFIVTDIKPTNIIRAFHVIDRTIRPHSDVWEVLKIGDTNEAYSLPEEEQIVYCSAISAVRSIINDIAVPNGNVKQNYVFEDYENYPVSLIANSVIFGGEPEGSSSLLGPLKRMLVDIAEARDTQLREEMEKEGAIITDELYKNRELAPEKFRYNTIKSDVPRKRSIYNLNWKSELMKGFYAAQIVVSTSAILSDDTISIWDLHMAKSMGEIIEDKIERIEEEGYK